MSNFGFKITQKVIILTLQPSNKGRSLLCVIRTPKSICQTLQVPIGAILDHFRTLLVHFLTSEEPKTDSFFTFWTRFCLLERLQGNYHPFQALAKPSRHPKTPKTPVFLHFSGSFCLFKGCQSIQKDHLSPSKPFRYPKAILVHFLTPEGSKTDSFSTFGTLQNLSKKYVQLLSKP